MRTVVTGGAGFIGSHVVKLLLAAGHKVAVVDDLSTGRQENLPAGVEFHHASILDASLADVCAGADVVVHAAAQTSVGYSVGDPEADARANIEGTAHVARTAAAAGVRRLVYLSSAAVYGPPRYLPVTEEHPLEPTSPYGLSKLTGERYIRLLARQTEMEWVILRLANVYGPCQSVAGEAGVVARWSSDLTARFPITLYGDGLQTRDFVYVYDVAQAVQRTIMAPQADGETLNIGTGEGTAILAVLGRLEQLFGWSAVVLRQPSRPGDLRDSRLDASRATRLLGWKATVPLVDGLHQTAVWYQAREKVWREVAVARERQQPEG